MKIISAVFLTSSTGLKQCPAGELPEFAFIGRSNVGKSSLINMITERKNLAKVSQTPGKTRLINHFIINGEWMLVDLPGYGYSKLSKTEKAKLEQMIYEYLGHRETLCHTFLLLDSRHELLKNDLAFINWLKKQHIPFSIIATKSDKLSKSQESGHIRYLTKILGPLKITIPVISTSSAKQKGRDEILDLISEVIENRK